MNAPFVRQGITAAFLLTLLGGAAVMSVAGAGAQEKKSGGPRARLCQVSPIETVMPRAANGTCPAPYRENASGLCVEESAVNNVFTYIINPDGSLDFGVSYWFPSGQNCGIIGHATRAGDGWRYENAMDSDDPDARCALNIGIKGDSVLFTVDGDASCRQECGAQAYLNHVTLPLAAVDRTATVTEKSFDPEIFYNTPCP